MKDLAVSLTLVAVFASCKSTASVSCRSTVNHSITDASQCTVAESCHVTNEHRVCDYESAGCCQQSCSAPARSRTGSWVGRNWWWLWGPKGLLKKHK